MRTHLPSELVSLDTKTLPPLVHPQCGSGQESSQELPATVLKACCSLRANRATGQGQRGLKEWRRKESHPPHPRVQKVEQKTQLRLVNPG